MWNQRVNKFLYFIYRLLTFVKSGAHSTTFSPPPLTTTALPDVGLPIQPSNKRKSTSPLLHSSQSKQARLTDSPAPSPSYNDAPLSSPYLGSSHGPMSSPDFGSSYGPMSTPCFGSSSAAASPHSSPGFPMLIDGISSHASLFTADLGELFSYPPAQYTYPGVELPLLPPHPDTYDGLNQEQLPAYPDGVLGLAD